jgi:hypothetical protein
MGAWFELASFCFPLSYARTIGPVLILATLKLFFICLPSCSLDVVESLLLVSVPCNRMTGSVHQYFCEEKFINTQLHISFVEFG